MPMFGKAAGSARKFFGSDAGQALLSTLSVFVPGDPYGFVQRGRRQDEKMAQQQRQQQQRQDAISGLISSYRGPDMETAGVNELIGGANETGFRFDQAPMQRQEPRYQPGFNPAAIGNFFGQGGSAADAKAMQDLMNPRPHLEAITSGGRTGTFNRDTGEFNMSAPDPLDLEYRRAQIEATRALVPQRTLSGQAAMIRATKPPAPRGAARGGNTNTPRPTGKVY